MTNEQKTAVEDLIRYIGASPTAFHAALETERRLRDAGFTIIAGDARWEAQPGARFAVRADGGLLLAVIVGEAPVAKHGVTVLAAHTDSPSLKVKQHGACWKRGYLTVPTETYGSPIRATWLDQPLGIAGRVIALDGSVNVVELPAQVVIPNLAIHLNRKVNDGFTYNEQDHLVAIIDAEADKSDSDAEFAMRTMVAGCVVADPSEVASYELALYDPTLGATLGLDERLLTGPRLDNLAGCYTSLQAFLAAESDQTRILALFDHEEIGSRSGDGALSDVILSAVNRLVALQSGDQEDCHIAAARSLVVSNDAAHALHPSFADKYDSHYAPMLGGGPVVKLSGTYRYATTAVTEASFVAACRDAGVPVQRLSVRSDMRAGSTVGPLTWARTRIPTVDVGLPLLAMHSIRETAGTSDVDAMIRALTSMLQREPTFSA